MSLSSSSLSAHFRLSGQIEPEGIYLSPPLEDECVLLIGWGEHPAHYARFTYNGVPLKGHTGLDIAAAPGSNVLATDGGKVTEISVEAGGFGRYIKLEHRWGESIYAHLGAILVETGQVVGRGQPLARLETDKQGYSPRLHFAIRLDPFNRFDGWGGFSDPLPYLYVSEIIKSEEIEPDENKAAQLPPLLIERPGMRRA
jgi:murein DD-endopeptidase MepM/ murein hydrolase activator NlpD